MIGSHFSVIIRFYYLHNLSGGIITQYAAILLSRQSLRPNRRTAWVTQSVEAVQWLQKQRIGLSGSIGMQTWELLTTLAVEFCIPLRLFIPASSDSDFDKKCREAARQFDPMKDLTEFIRVPVLLSDGKQNGMALRDRMVCEQSDFLVPISVRRGGIMSRLVKEGEATGKVLVRDLQIEYRRPNTRMSYNPGEKRLADPTGPAGPWLIHWTRGVSGTWPGERTIDLYRAVLESDHWPRSALDTLERIVASGTIRATARHMPNGIPTVCSSGLPPRDVIPLMRWRARYGEMSFEPYGIGIDSAAARQAGVRPVLYHASGAAPETATARPWLTQSAGKKTDWRHEHEYRCKGDFDLGALPTDRITLFCQTKKEAARLSDRFPYRVIPLFEDA